jgi:GGDEF domain-containing protein
MKPAFALMAPGLFVVLPLAVWYAVAPDSPALAEAAHGFPYVAIAAAALLGWRFGRSRIVGSALVLLLVQAFAVAQPQLPVAHVAGMLTAPLLAVLALTADRRLRARRAIVQLTSVMAVALAAFVGAGAAPAHIATVFEITLVDAPFTGASSLPQVALCGAFLGLLVLTVLALLRRRALEAGLAWCAMAATQAANATAQAAGAFTAATNAAAAPASAATTAAGVWMLAAALCLGLAMVEATYALAYQDELTGLRGRRALNERLAQLRAPAVIGIVDIDRFKSVNDRHGHDVGDQVLRMVASHLARVGGGEAFRSGGEEFTLVFPGSTLEEARRHAERLRRAVAAEKFTVRSAARSAGRNAARKRRTPPPARRKRLRVTISTGLAALPARDAVIEHVVKSADKALYRAKQTGRNRTETARTR